MARIARKNLRQFGVTGPASSFGQFGSKRAGVPQTSQNPTVLQQLGAWLTGWQDAVVASNKAAYLEDMNGWCFVHSYMVAYLMQQGIPEWDTDTVYYTAPNPSIVQYNGGQWYMSLQDANAGNAPPAGASNAFWRWLNPPQDLAGAATLNFIPKVTNAASANGAPGSVVLADSAVSENGTHVVIGKPIKFPDNSVQSTAATSVVTTQNILGPTGANTRAIGVVYQNTLSRPIFVAASFGSIAGVTPVTFSAKSDANPAPTTVVAQSNVGTASDGVLLFFIVLPGSYYTITRSIVDSSLTYWTEWT